MAETRFQGGKSSDKNLVIPYAANPKLRRNVEPAHRRDYGSFENFAARP